MAGGRDETRLNIRFHTEKTADIGIMPSVFLIVRQFVQLAAAVVEHREEKDVLHILADHVKESEHGCAGALNFGRIVRLPRLDQIRVPLGVRFRLRGQTGLLLQSGKGGITLPGAVEGENVEELSAAEFENSL